MYVLYLILCNISVSKLCLTFTYTKNNTYYLENVTMEIQTEPSDKTEPNEIDNGLPSDKENIEMNPQTDTVETTSKICFCKIFIYITTLMCGIYSTLLLV